MAFQQSKYQGKKLQFVVHIHPTPMAHYKIKEDLAQIHWGTGANIIKEGADVMGQGV